MKLLLIRHAIAEDRAESSRDRLADDLRPLTDGGRRKMERGARGLAGLLPDLGLIATSPLVRAHQTAEIVAAAFGDPPVVETDSLVPGADPRRFLTWLAGRSTPGPVAAIGHLPHLGLLAGRLLGARSRGGAAVRVKKGSAILFELGPRGAAGAPSDATLLWALAPAHLRRLGER